MARDWLWPKASFKGAEFYVEQQQLPGGNRIIKHTYPYSNKHDIENLGRNPDTFQVNAYFASETADADSQALKAALENDGPGLLMLPMFGAQFVQADTWSREWNQAKLNYVGFSILFTEASTSDSPASEGMGERELADMTSGFGDVLSGAVDALFTAVAPLAFALADAGEALLDFADTLATVADGLSLPSQVAQVIAASLDDGTRALQSGAFRPGQATGNLCDLLDLAVTEAQASAPADILSTAAAAMLDQANALQSGAVTPAAAAIPVAGAMAFIASALRCLAIASYTDRRQAIAARDRMATLAQAVQPLYGQLGPDAVAAFDAVWGEAAIHLSGRIASLAPVVAVEINRSMPSTVIAYTLYGDPSRATDLVARNRIAAPLLMPTRFEAAAT